MTQVDAYISQFPEHVQLILRQIRKVILEHAPEAAEEFSYGMPTYKLNRKPLVYFAAFKKHIGFYATPTDYETFAKELAGYKQGRGSVQFPLNAPIPFELIARIVEFRVSENKAI